MTKSRSIALALVASVAAATAVAQPALAAHRDHLVGSGTGTLAFVGDPADVIEKHNGTVIFVDLPVAGTINVTGNGLVIEGTFTGVDTLKTRDVNSRVRGSRTYELTGFGTCVGDEKGTGPNEFGGVDFDERLRCADGTKIRLSVSDVSLDESGFHRTITAEVN